MYIFKPSLRISYLIAIRLGLLINDGRHSFLDIKGSKSDVATSAWPATCNFLPLFLNRTCD